MNIYLFDFDGTLVDSMPTFVSIMLRILDENNIEYNNDIVRVITPLGYKKTAEYFQKLGITIPTNQLVNIMNEYALNEYLYKINAKENVVETLKKLKSKNISLNILTASPHIMLDPCLKRIGIWNLFDNIWSCDDFSMSKSNPQLFINVANKLGCSIEKILFIDDNIEAVKNAKISGMKVCGIYDDSSKELVEEMKKETDFYIEKFNELLDIK